MPLSSRFLLPALLSTVVAATVTATTSYFFYDSHRILLHKKKLAKLRERQLKLKPKRNTCGKILFVSQIGTSKAFAKRLCEFLASKVLCCDRVYLELVDAGNYEPEELPKENIVLLVASNSEHWKRPPESEFISSRKRYLTDKAEDFGRWLKDNAKNFGSGVFVVNARSFSVFGVGSSVSEDGKNLMAKAANHIRDLGHAAKFDSAFDFDNWWQGVVAVLKGAVLGDTVTDGKCEQSESEDNAGCCDPKHIYMLVENRYEGYRSTTYRRKMLTISEANFMMNGTVDLEDGGPITDQWPLPDGATSDSRLPFSKGFCSVGLSLFFAGGDVDYIVREPTFHIAAKMWCLKYDGSAWIWSFYRSMFFHSRSDRPIVIPYNGKLCIVGICFNLWVDIYELKSEFWERRDVPAIARLDPHSYFLWKNLIVLYSFKDQNQRLMSYDLNANIWSPIECNFPPICNYPDRRKVIRLGCSDYLLIIDFITIWCIYNLSKKKPVAIVHVNDLDEMGIVSNIFCCHHTSKESLIYVFIDPVEMDLEEESFTGPDRYINVVPYARVKLQTDDNFSAKVESKGNLKVGPYMQYYVFAAGDQDTKKEKPL